MTQTWKVIKHMENNQTHTHTHTSHGNMEINQGPLVWCELTAAYMIAELP